MSRRFDLNAPQNNNNGNRRTHHNPRPSHNTASFSNDEENINDNPATENISSQGNPKVNDEAAEGIAKRFLRNKVPRGVAESKPVDTIIDKTIKNAKLKIAIKVITSTAIFLLPLILFILLVAYITVVLDIFIEEEESASATGTNYYLRCSEVNVITTDSGGNSTSKTYPLEEYVAGVVAGEVGGFNNLEVYKAFAIAARTYFASVENNCTIVSGESAQVFRETSDKLIIQAAEETKGQVILKDNNLLMTEYDAFCFIEKTNEYYTLSQVNQKIPTSWVDSHVGSYGYKNCPCEKPDPSMTNCFNSEGRYLDGGHGRGMSQYGALYLATEENLTHEQILAYYYGSDIVISTGAISTIAGLEIKNTTRSTVLNVSLDEYLKSKGSSAAVAEQSIHDTVLNYGVGTRAGVVTAAVSLVNYLYDNYNVRIPYYWGGQYQYVGINHNFGAATSTSITPGGSHYSNQGLDCSGFVSWAIRNGGYKLSRQTTAGFHRLFSGDSCIINNSSCVGQPGDLINSASCHVQMIVSVDEAHNSYYVAESTGSYGVIMRQVPMHQSNCRSAETRLLHMDNFYNNQKNVDTSYTIGR